MKIAITLSILLFYCITNAKTNSQVDVSFSGDVTSSSLNQHLEKIIPKLDEEKPNTGVPSPPISGNCNLSYPDFDQISREIESLHRGFEHELDVLKNKNDLSDELIKEALVVERVQILPEDIVKTVRRREKVRQDLTAIVGLKPAWATWGSSCGVAAPQTQKIDTKTANGLIYDSTKETLTSEQLRELETKVFIKGEKKELTNPTSCNLPGPNRMVEEENIRKKDQQIQEAQNDLKVQITEELKGNRILTESSIEDLLKKIRENKKRILQESNIGIPRQVPEYTPQLDSHVEYQALLLELTAQSEISKLSNNLKEADKLNILHGLYKGRHNSFTKAKGDPTVELTQQSLEVLNKIRTEAKYKLRKENPETEGYLIFDFIIKRINSVIFTKVNPNPTPNTAVDDYTVNLLSKFSLFVLDNVLKFYKSLDSQNSSVLDKKFILSRIEIINGYIAQKTDPTKLKRDQFDYTYEELYIIIEELQNILQTNSDKIIDKFGGRGALYRILRLKDLSRQIQVRVSPVGLTVLKAHYQKMKEFVTDCTSGTNSCDYKSRESWDNFRHEKGKIDKRIERIHLTGLKVKDISRLNLEDLQEGLREMIELAQIIPPSDKKTLEAHFIFLARNILRQNIEAYYGKSDEISLAGEATIQGDTKPEYNKIPLPVFEERNGYNEEAKREPKIEDLEEENIVLYQSEQFSLFVVETYLKYYQKQIDKLNTSLGKVTDSGVINRINNLIKKYQEDGNFLKKLKEKLLIHDEQFIPDYKKYSLEGIIEWINNLNEIIKSTPISMIRKIRVHKVVHVALNTQRVALQKEIIEIGNQTPEQIQSSISIPTIPSFPSEFKSVKHAKAYKEKYNISLENLRRVLVKLEKIPTQDLHNEWKLAINKCLSRIKITSLYIQIQKMIKERELIAEQLETRLIMFEKLKYFCNINPDIDRPTTTPEGTLKCLKGKYLKDGYCWPCPYSQCSACTGPNLSDCTECSNNHQMNERGICIKSGNKCSEQELERDGKCYPKCRVGCKSCSEDGKICNECVSSYFLLNKRCRRRCPRFFWFRDIKNKECKRCHDKCKSCVGSSMKHCSSCIDYHYLKVPVQFGATKSCEECPENCLRCQESKDNNSVECTRCKYGYKLNFKTKVCEKICEEGCRKCDFRFPKICKQCESNKIIFNGKCLPGCPIGQIRQIEEKIQNEFINYERETDPAHENQDVKTGLSTISESASRANVEIDYKDLMKNEEFKNDREDPISWECVNIFSCPRDTYRSVYSPGCRACDSDTETPIKGFCIKCSKSCQGCDENKNKCINCAKGFVRTKRGRCVRKRGPSKENKCEENQFKDNKGYCWDCHESCATCMGPSENHCYTCSNQEFKSTGRSGRPGTCTCAAGTYSQPPVEWCIKCDDTNCAFCQTGGIGKCYRCQKGFYRTKEGTCISIKENRQKLIDDGILSVLTFKRINPQDQVGDTVLYKGDGLFKYEKIEVSNQRKRGVPKREVEPSFRVNVPVENMSDQIKQKLNINLNYAGELWNVILENLKEGIDYYKEFKIFKESGIMIDIYFKKDVNDQKIEISGRDPTALRTPMYETFDGEMEESNEKEAASTNSNTRILQENDPFGVAEDVDAPLIETESYSTSINAKKIPDESQINLAFNLGKGLRGFIYALVFLCSLFQFSQFAIPEYFHAHFLKFWLLVKFVSRAGLINVNFGYLLTRIFDKIFGIELALMFDIISDEALYRFSTGKISNNRVSSLVINAAPIGILLYLVIFLLNLVNTYSGSGASCPQRPKSN